MIWNTNSQLNMFGFGSGYQMFGGMNFLNGFGCNTESMMWMNIGNMLANYTEAAVSQGVKAKQEAKANSPEVQLKDVEKEIETKTDAKASLDSEHTKKTGELNTLNTELDGYNKELAGLQSKVVCDKAIADFKAAKSSDANYAELKAAAEKADDDNEKRDDLEGKVKTLKETTIPNKEQEIKNLKEKIDNATKEIEALNAKRDELKAEIQQAKDAKLFNKVDGNAFSKRTKEDDLYKLTFNSDTCPASEADWKGAIYTLRMAQKGGNSDTIKKAAKKAKEVYDALPDAMKRQYSDAYEGIKRALN